MGTKTNLEIAEDSLIKAALACVKFCHASDDIKPIKNANIMAGKHRNGGTKGCSIKLSNNLVLKTNKNEATPIPRDQTKLAMTGDSRPP